MTGAAVPVQLSRSPTKFAMLAGHLGFSGLFTTTTSTTLLPDRHGSVSGSVTVRSSDA